MTISRKMRFRFERRLMRIIQKECPAGDLFSAIAKGVKYSLFAELYGTFFSAGP